MAFLLASLVLSACTDSTPQPNLEPILTTILPAPATPGQMVTLYGRLLAKTNSVLFGTSTSTAVTILGTPVKDGLSFELPKDTQAGSYEVTVPTIAGQKLTLEVLPRLDSIRFTGQTLVIQGAGWGSDPRNALAELNGQRLIVTGDQNTLSTTVNALSPSTGTVSDLYGVFNVRILVGERASETKTVKKEAVSISGHVNLPLTATAFKAQSVPGSAPLPSLKVLMPLDTVAPLQGLIRITALSSLRRLQAEYHSLEDAAAALNLLKQQHIAAEYDQAVQVSGSAQSFQPLGSNLEASQWFWPLLGLTQAWTTSKGKGVVVAVIDTGVALTHPDLKANLLPGRDFVDDDLDPSDQNGHGTHVAGLIAARGQVTGAAPEASILPVRVIGPQGGTVSQLVQGMLWAAGLDAEHPNPNPAQVINLSLGTSEFSALLQEAVQKVLDAGIVVVAATGNDGGLPYSPANIPGVIAVTSIAGPLTTYQPSYSNRGPGTRLAAYGGDLNNDQDANAERDGILSTDLDANNQPGYALRQGTSMATPQISGIAALLLAQGTPARTVKALLEGQATDLGVAGMDLNTGWGLVNAQLTLADPELYVVALDAQQQVITYVRANQQNFTLNSLPPEQNIKILAGTDRNHNGILGEAGELLSAPLSLQTKTLNLNQVILQLKPSDGGQALTLPR